METKIGIIGHFGGNQCFTDGQTVKTKEINRQIEKHYGLRTKKFDTYKNSHNIFKLIFGVNKLLKGSDVVILIVSERGYKILNILLPALNKFYNKRLFDFVIGGTRYKLYDKSKIQAKNAKKYEKIYVETNHIKKEYEIRNIKNVEVFPNFKQIQIQDGKVINKDKSLKLCTFSRIRKEKGIEDAIAAVNKANSKLGDNLVELCIYGKPDKEYEKEFSELLNTLPKTITYGGLISPNKSTEVIKQYDAMLFLTYWKSEGFPGTIIDSLSAGVPVIATDWNCNFEILKENYTGIKVKTMEPNSVANKLIKIANNKSKLHIMRKNCINEANKYKPEKIMSIFYEEIEEHKK